MSYKARVFRVFIASPSDVLLEREITRNVLEQWNSINSEREKIVLVRLDGKQMLHRKWGDQHKTILIWTF